MCPTNATVVPIMCEGNTYATPGSFRCIECPEGYFSNFDHTNCEETTAAAFTSWYKDSKNIVIMSAIGGAIGIVAIGATVLHFIKSAVSVSAAFIV